ncbi:MAG: diguanylate cyclase [Oscillospiraceae bacterium]
MNPLSALSTVIYTAFFIGSWHMLTAQRKSVLNRPASVVLFCLGWWSFCNSFFFAAATQEQAWFWHKLSAIGWCGFVAFTAYYFLELTGYGKPFRAWWKQALFFAPTVILLCKNLFGKTTSLAQNVVQSTSGWGWTYENSITSPWLWLYLLYVALYFITAFYLLNQWANSVNHKLKKRMALWFIALDTLTILCGVVTDVILPLTAPVLPALASVATAIFGIGYFFIIYRYDLFNINLVISSDDILRTSNNSLFVLDENQEILRCNPAAGALLGYTQSGLLGRCFANLTVEPLDFSTLNTAGSLNDGEARLLCRDGTMKDVLLSASVAEDQHNSFLCIIVSCQDVSKQKRVQEELELERENYKKLAADYQLLAYYDPLTGLPNRRQFYEKLHDFEKLYLSGGSDFAVIFLDLDNFKHANDLYGHKGGDELLIAAARKLQACAEGNEFVARLGGDEFMVIMPYTGVDFIEKKLQQIQAEFRKSVTLDGGQYEIGVSAGYGVFSQIGDATRLMQRADEAMYDEKKELLNRRNASI